MNRTQPTAAKLTPFAIWTPDTGTTEAPIVARPAVPGAALDPTVAIPAPWLRPAVTARYQPARFDLGGLLLDSWRGAKVATVLFVAAALGFVASVIGGLL